MILLFLCRIRLENDRTDNYLQAIKDNYSPSLQIAVTILTSNRKDRYDAIKKLCCVEMPGETEFNRKIAFKRGSIVTVRTVLKVVLVILKSP